MVMPVTYPAAVTYGINADVVGSYKRYKKGARQKTPFNLVLPYRFEAHWTERGWKAGGIMSGIYNRMAGFSPLTMRSYPMDISRTAWIDLRTRLRGKLESEFRVTAELGTTIAEGRQAWSMITNRALMLAKFGIALKKGNFYEAAKTLGVLKHPSYKRLSKESKLKRGSHNFGNNYLEFHFGWTPLISDMGNAMAVLDEPIPYGQYKVRTGSRTVWRHLDTATFYQQWADHRERNFGKAGAYVKVTNPNLYLASNMGLTNPASIAWELVPFSFVVDWFWNVGDYIKSFSDMYGIEFEEPWHAIGSRVTTVSNQRTRAVSYGPYNVATAIDIVSHSTSFERFVGLPSVNLRRKGGPLFADKPRRALAAISLLIQQGLGKR